MNPVESFGVVILAAGLVGLAAVLSNRVSERIHIPAPAIFLGCAAVASDVFPRLGGLRVETVEQVVSVALALILFNGGMHIGWRKLRPVAAATLWLGVAGTLVTAGALAWCAHLLFGLDWRAALLLGTALSPTDPAVVFSVLGRREVGGRSGVLLEGESGANDPVSIALMLALLGTNGAGARVIGVVAGQFALQLLVGLAVGVAGGWLLGWLMRRAPLPSEGLYPLRVLAGALVVYGAASAAHGSGFLAVFAAGIVIGDQRAPYKREIERFHTALASQAEIVAFVLLGLTIRLADLPRQGAWLIGLVLAVLLVVVIRPVLVGLLSWPVRLRLGERGFVLWTGLKGAVPILLGAFIVTGGVAGSDRLYEIVFVVVAFSVLVQGSLVPTLAGRLGVPLRMVEPEPWSLGVRFREEPEKVRRYRVAAGSAADGAAISQLPLGEGTWVSLVLRHGRLVSVRPETRLQVGDEVIALAERDTEAAVTGLFRPARHHDSSPDAGGHSDA